MCFVTCQTWGHGLRVCSEISTWRTVFTEKSQGKPRAAPRHEADLSRSSGGSEAAETAESVSQKNAPLLGLLRSVYVESKDPAAAEASQEVSVETEGARRPLRFSVPGGHYGLVERSDVPRGKLTIAETLKALGSHQRHPQTWTRERSLRNILWT
ncbi:hypothetical protein F7725_013574 [Dissostichus mawsoni]|uniref:NADH dehydrogenase [ubiquinone] 1 alpha subcomplex assembly factor 4 n=1 Tax=Dissostichus mawsoni TaxID=36200 RepID=A0A7J5Y550_DISMA|nr:hypothetical protein F7725_013574 [Dissostichus mawsoni]